MKYPKDYIIFDIETTGFSGATDKCTEIAAIKYIDGKKIAEFNVLLNWNIEIPSHITEITTITKALLDAEGISPLKALEAFLDFIGTTHTVIGHNVLKFDIPFLFGNFEHPLIEELYSRCLDTAALYKMKKLGMVFAEDEFNHLKVMKDVLNARHSIKYSVNAACEEFQINKSSVTQHRALGDCYLTNEIYKKLIA